MKAIYLCDFESRESLYKQFEIAPDDKENILFAWYGRECYDGKAFVLFSRDGKLYEVNGSHCSCRGLEGQWDPEEVSVANLRYRMTEGCLGKTMEYMGGYEGECFADILEQCLKDYEAGQ
jgi:hypothetical protein